MKLMLLGYKELRINADNCFDTYASLHDKYMDTLVLTTMRQMDDELFICIENDTIFFININHCKWDHLQSDD